MNEEQQFKQAALTAGMLNLKEEFDNRFRKVVEDWQNAVAALLLNVDETWRAKNEVSWFETIHDNKAGHKVWDGEPVLEVKGAPFDEKSPRDWSQATPSKVPVERWKPEVGATYWVVIGNGVPQSTSWINSKLDGQYFEMGNCFQTIEEALAARDRVKKALKGE